MSNRRHSGHGGPPGGEGPDGHRRSRPAVTTARKRRVAGLSKPAGSSRKPPSPAGPKGRPSPARRDIERMIAEGRIAINGKPLDTPATILSSLEGVTVDNRPVADTETTRLFLFHKPAGVLTTARDPAGRPTIYDILPQEQPRGLPRLMPVGRLDLSTEGLLLLTNDGELKRALELPSSEVPRSYRVRAFGEVRQQALEALAMGMTIDGVRYGPVDASVDRRSHAGAANLWLTMTLAEGKNREVRRLCEGIGLKVSRLIRTSYGPFLLADLPVRALLEVPAVEVEALKRTLKARSRKPANS